jgi:hypothetical protein
MPVISKWIQVKYLHILGPLTGLGSQKRRRNTASRKPKTRLPLLLPNIIHRSAEVILLSASWLIYHLSSCIIVCRMVLKINNGTEIAQAKHVASTFHFYERDEPTMEASMHLSDPRRYLQTHLFAPHHCQRRELEAFLGNIKLYKMELSNIQTASGPTSHTKI